jgi:nucleoside-diphosphate-sugar epimerase
VTLVHRAARPANPERVVVLGSRGFVGSHLLAALHDAGIAAVGISTADLDLTRVEAGHELAARLHEDDALVVVSALTPDRGKDVATLMRNLTMGASVCEAVATRPPRHLVYISSDAVYSDDVNPVRERSCTGPAGLHGVMHLVRERMLIESVRGPRVPLTLLRPTLLYGAGDTHNGYGPNRFMRSALNEGRIALFGAGEERRDHVHVDDLGRIVRLVVQHRSEGVLNVATGTSHSFRDVAEHVARLVGRPVAIESSPRASAVTHRHFDVTAAVAAFPSFGYTPLGEGLASALEGLMSAVRA